MTKEKIYNMTTNEYLQLLSRRYITVQKELDIELLQSHYNDLSIRFKAGEDVEDLLIVVQDRMAQKRKSLKEWLELLNKGV